MSANTLLVKMAWALCNEVSKNGYHIGCLTSDIAEKYKSFGMTKDDGYELKDAIIEGLEELSSEIYKSDDGTQTVGFWAEEGCYWWTNNATSEWTVDCPDWWDENRGLKYVDFGTGAGNYESTLSLEALKSEVEEDLAYTQQSIKISDHNDNLICTLPWYGTEPEDDDEVVAQFGTLGFYGNWIEE